MLQLELRRFHVPGAAMLWSDLSLARAAPFRCLHMLYERDGWNPTSVDGRHFLNGLLRVMPDNKVIEDAHNVIRRDARGNPNPIQRTSRRHHSTHSRRIPGSRQTEQEGVGVVPPESCARGADALVRSMQVGGFPGDEGFGRNVYCVPPRRSPKGCAPSSTWS